jgi:hypothetical protein
VPSLAELEGLLAHSSLRLSSNHAGYEPLWREQLGDAWREPKPLSTWPVLKGGDKRWAVRAVIDVVVADAYGLAREQYAHVLSSFSHRSYPKAPELCLARFDELKEIGLEAFTKKYDPYWDIPVNENLPQPVIDLPISGLLGPEAKSLPLAAEARPEYRRAQVPTPSIETQAGVTTSEEPANPTISRRHRSGSQPLIAADTYELVKLLLEENSVISSAEVQELTGLNALAIRSLLKQLIDDGCAVQLGHGRGTRYRHRARDH